MLPDGGRERAVERCERRVDRERRDIALQILRQHTIDAMRLEKERRVSFGQYLTSAFARHAPRGLKRLVPPTVKRYLLRLVFGS